MSQQQAASAFRPSGVKKKIEKKIEYSMRVYYTLECVVNIFRLLLKWKKKTWTYGGFNLQLNINITHGLR